MPYAIEVHPSGWGPWGVWGGSLAERLFGLDCEADGYFAGTVENLKRVVAKQAPILAPRPITVRQLNAPVASPTFGADNIAFFHHANMRRGRPVCKIDLLEARFGTR